MAGRKVAGRKVVPNGGKKSDTDNLWVWVMSSVPTNNWDSSCQNTIYGTYLAGKESNRVLPLFLYISCYKSLQTIP